MKRLIVITGISRGLGRAMTEEFINLGHTVIGCARSKSAVENLTNKYGNSHQFSCVNVADEDSVQEWVRYTLTNYSPPDLLINNAAIINQPAPVWKIDSEEFSQLIDINIKGVANVIRHFVPAMISRGSGIIVNISSGWGRSTSPQVGPYCASKWAIEGLTRALSQELPSGIAAIPLNPGIIHTDMLDICFGEDAKSFTPIESWTKKAVPFLLNLKVQDNGIPLTIS
ncbi:MAG: SDR family NAD(P)-dependent oxidoreductase [Trichodesmium sp. St18_bin1]|jgi:NAD(P)-dependent dehydrogenase (short-subunit alcohol dehydrogenase family)|nr:SDR family NAD(P)-dependent oxidoreductase [Trichodesmium sp. St18_bin1]MDE5121177.1 SDR family NAD(P)-dependent oxidoreductase [Trichodesmium sp. St19_bin1]